jgi:hypothetical protein
LRPTKAQKIFHAISALDEQKSRQVASIAIGIEALEALLVERSIIREGELMEKVERLMLEKSDAVA